MKPRRFYLDTNVFIILLETKDRAFETFVEKAAARNVFLFTSEITLAELLVRPLRDGDAETVSASEALLVSGELLNVVPADRGILRESAQLRAQLGNKLPDAIHIATAVDRSCEVFISEDRRLKLPAALRQVAVNELGEVEL